MTRLKTGLICLLLCLTLTVLTGGGWAETDTNNRLEQRFDSPTIVFQDSLDDFVLVDEIIEVLEKARPYIWEEYSQITTSVFDSCRIDPICLAQREVDRMRARKALREKIDRILKVLK